MSFRAAVMPGPGLPIEIHDLPEPDLLEGEVLLETIAGEVCGTDVHIWHGRLAGVPFPIIPGHVSVGRILARRGVNRDALGSPLGDGDVVTFLDVHGTCHRCPQCTIARQPNRCPERRVYGITFPLVEGLLGGWAEAIRLLAGVHILKLPAGVSAERLIGGGCGLFTGFAAVERSHLAMGDTVLVQGSGPVGLSAAAFAHLRGAARVFVIGDPASRLDLARGFGAVQAWSLTGSSRDERRDSVMGATGGRGVDVVIEAAGQPPALTEGLGLLRDGGRYVVAGHYTDTGEVALNPHIDVNRKHAEVVGQWGTDLRHLVGAVRMLERHGDALAFERVIGGRYPLERAGQALRDVERMAVTKAILVPGAA